MKARYLILMAGVVMFAGNAFAYEEGECGANCHYKIDDDGLVTISGTGEMRSDWSLYNRSEVKNVVIESGITNISDYAFGNNTNLISVSIPDTVKSIGNNAFEGVGKKMPATINLPDSVEVIGARAFKDTTIQNSLTLPSNLKYVGEFAFENGLNPDRVRFESFVLPDGIIRIDQMAFSGVGGRPSDRHFVLPDSLEILGASAFGEEWGYTISPNSRLSSESCMWEGRTTDCFDDKKINCINAEPEVCKEKLESLGFSVNRSTFASLYTDRNLYMKNHLEEVRQSPTEYTAEELQYVTKENNNSITYYFK